MTANAIDHQAVVKCIEIGDGNITSIFEMMPTQVATMCHKIHNDPDFAGKEMSIVGISQGGLIARSVVEMCEGLNIHTLFTFGSPHMGVTVYQKCRKWWCPIANHILGYLAEWAIVQDFCAPADYYRTWWNFARFHDKNIFLQDVNNENDTKNPVYKSRLSSIKNFGLWMWMEDNTVVPKESEWFGFWDDKRDVILLKHQ